MRVSSWRAVFSAGVAVLVLAGVSGWVGLHAAPALSAQDAQAQTINHVKPRRDSSGPIPDRFEWTAGVRDDVASCWHPVVRSCAALEILIGFH